VPQLLAISWGLSRSIATAIRQAERSVTLERLIWCSAGGMLRLFWGSLTVPLSGSFVIPDLVTDACERLAVPTCDVSHPMVKPGAYQPEGAKCSMRH
jgi:hypothetical protein